MKAKKAGIWMDHAHANILEFTDGSPQAKTLESAFTPEVGESALHRGEKLMHRKEQQQQAAYYEKLCDVIANYKDVVLFGPTQAKIELHNYLLKNQRCNGVKVAVKDTDKLTENQQHAFVKEYFSKH